MVLHYTVLHTADRCEHGAVPSVGDVMMARIWNRYYSFIKKLAGIFQDQYPERLYVLCACVCACCVRAATAHQFINPNMFWLGAGA